MPSCTSDFVARLSSTSDVYPFRTNGLCGRFDNNALHDFVFPNNTRAFDSIKNGRYNTKAMYDWGAMWGVDGINHQPLMDHFHTEHDPCRSPESMPVI